MICADGWYPPVYERLKTQRCDILLQPSFGVPDDHWGKFWRGYSGYAAPTGVDLLDSRRLTEAEAWIKYSMVSRIASCGARYDVNTFMVGKVWDLRTGGQSRLVRKQGEKVEYLLSRDQLREQLLYLETE